MKCLRFLLAGNSGQLAFAWEVPEALPFHLHLIFCASSCCCLGWRENIATVQRKRALLGRCPNTRLASHLRAPFVQRGIDFVPIYASRCGVNVRRAPQCLRVVHGSLENRNRGNKNQGVLMWVFSILPPQHTQGEKKAIAKQRQLLSSFCCFICML